ncbi:MAG TPA: prepilin-type N-terminal cleavage/methylation domain-containing protein [Thermoanaerobaculia bacterium]|jgi:type II secretory pathway pseudopilin PulG
MERERPGSTMPRRQAGFTLVEMLVALAITIVLLLAVLAAFDLNSRMTKVQTNVADMQQSSRIAQDDLVRLLRMAGRGGLPLVRPDPRPPVVPAPNRLITQGVAVAVQDNVPDNQRMVAGDPATLILPGTDVLTVRGVFSTLYRVRITDPLELNPPANPTSGRVLLRSAPIPNGPAQDLQPLLEALRRRSEPLLLVSSFSDAVYVMVNSGDVAWIETKKVGEEETEPALAVDFTVPVPGRLSSREDNGFPADLKSAAFLGILEEHRYYIREDHAIANDRGSDLAPKLARARFVPGTNQPYQDDPNNARLDLADNVLDLQVALGFDSPNAGGSRASDLDNDGSDDQIVETADGKNDDWLLNSTSDGVVVTGMGPLQYLRVTTVVRTDRRDFKYQAPLLPDRIEDRAYPANDPLNSPSARMFRWRQMRTVVDLRNL